MPFLHCPPGYLRCEKNGYVYLDEDWGGAGWNVSTFLPFGADLPNQVDQFWVFSSIFSFSSVDVFSSLNDISRDYTITLWFNVSDQLSQVLWGSSWNPRVSGTFRSWRLQALANLLRWCALPSLQSLRLYLNNIINSISINPWLLLKTLNKGLKLSKPLSDGKQTLVSLFMVLRTRMLHKTMKPTAVVVWLNLGPTNFRKLNILIE